MNKLRIIGIILFIFSIMTTIQAQSYNRLWKQVEEQEKKDLPKSVIAEAQKIFEKAKAEKNAPQMMKAYLTMMTYRGEIAPERTKGLSQSGNDTQLWLYLVVKAKLNAVKNNTA